MSRLLERLVIRIADALDTDLGECIEKGVHAG